MNGSKILIDSNYIKTKVLEYWRFKRGFYIAGTEVSFGSNIADLLLSDDSQIIEIEVKINLKDLIADFKKCKYTDIDLMYCNKLYFALPCNLISEAKEIIYDYNDKYGLISVNADVTIIKSARKIKTFNDYYKNKIKKYIIMRSTSELVSNRLKSIEQNNY